MYLTIILIDINIFQLIYMEKDTLPRKLHVQLDNTCRENKNQFVFTFFAYLVETNVFDEVCSSKCFNFSILIYIKTFSWFLIFDLIRYCSVCYKLLIYLLCLFYI